MKKVDDSNLKMLAKQMQIVAGLDSLIKKNQGKDFQNKSF
jgi:hypothetical protein